MIFPTLILLATLATIQAKAPTTCPAVDSQTSVYIPDEDCSKFWQCSNGTPYLFDCPAGLHFNPTLNVCDWPQNVNCVGPKELCDSSKCPAVDGPNSIYHPTSDCSKFCQCSNGVAYLHDCPSGLEFNPVLNVCDWPENAGCSEGSGGGSNESDSKEESNEVVNPSTLPPKTSTTEKASSSSSTTKAASPTTTAAPTKPPGPTTDSSKSSSSANPTTSATTEAASSTTTVAASTGSGNNNDGLCDSSKCPAVDGPDSVYQPTEDCTKFCQCSNGVAILHNCPEGLDFNPILNVCDWPEVAGCRGGESSSSTSSSAAPTKSSESTTGSLISSSSSNPTTSSSTTEVASSATAATPTKPAESTTDSSKSSSSVNPTSATTEAASSTTEAASSTTDAASSTTKTASSATTEAASSTTTVAPSTGSDNNNDGLCDSSKCPAVDGPDSVYQPTEDCTKFCQCSNGVAILHNCPENLDFNPILNVCDWPEVAGCRGGESSSSSSSSVAPTKASESTTDSSKSSSTSNPTTSSSTTEVASTTTEKASSTAASESSSSANPTTSSSTTKAASTTTEAAPSTTTVAPSTGSENNNEGLCDSSKCPAVDGPDSVYQPTEDCTKFCQCSNGVAILHNCPTGLDFNPVLNVCDWPEVAGCRAVESSSSVAPTKPSETTTDSTISSSSSNPTTLSSTTKETSSTSEAASSTTTATPTKPAESTTDSPKSSSSANPTTSATTEPASSTTEAATSATKPASSTTEAASSTTAVTPSTGSGNNNGGICDSSKCPAVDGPDSVYQPTEDCSKFCQCSNGVAILHNCPEGLDFNPILNVCDWPEVAGCSGRGSSSSSSSSAAPTKPAESTTDSLKSSSSSNPTSSSTTEAASTTTTAAPTKPAESTTDSPKSSSPANPTTSATTKAASSTTEAASSTTTVAPSTGLCDSSKCPAVDGPDSVYQPTKDCTKFCQCSNGVAILHNCPAGLEFNPVLNVCDWPQNAGCSGRSSPSLSTAKPTTSPATEVPSSTKKPTKPTTSTAAPSNGRSCDSTRCPAVDGLNSVYLELDDCTKFCQCSNGVAILHKCPKGLHFSSILNVCDWPEVAGCKKP